MLELKAGAKLGLFIFLTGKNHEQGGRILLKNRSFKCLFALYLNME